MASPQTTPASTGARELIRYTFLFSGQSNHLHGRLSVLYAEDLGKILSDSGRAMFKLSERRGPVLSSK
jgi:hypothetical protein